MKKSPLLLEICCGSAQDAIAAAKGGAQRVELNSDLFHGGITPTIGSLIVAKRHIDIPVMCMVRPREGGFHYTDAEFEVMLEDAGMLLKNGADGIVFGFLDADGQVDAQRTQRMLDIIGEHDSVFHRAIDVVPDVFSALDTLAALGVKRVLTSGQQPTVIQGTQTICDMLAHAAGRIEILPGGGITLQNAKECRHSLGVDMLHAAVHRTAYDHSCRMNTAIYFGGAIYPPEDRYLLTDARDIAELYASAND